jgi:hypothetical protein
LTGPVLYPLAGLSIGGLMAAMLLSRLGFRHGHWLAIMGSVVALAIGWLAGIAG